MGLIGLKRSLKALLCKLVWVATIYHIYQRNVKIHGGQFQSEDRMIQMIKWEVKTKICDRDSNNKSEVNIALWKMGDP